MLSPSQIAGYLRRIRYAGDLSPSAQVLRDLHRAHLYSVPFENLDISLGIAIVLDENRLYDKVINRRRGGFCYELNGLFAALLRGLGFQVTLLSARVVNEAGALGPEFDHLTLRVDIAGAWLADVGFGDSFLEPLALQEDIEDLQGGFVYTLRRGTETGWILLRRSESGRDWRVQYAFSETPRSLPNFREMCEYHQHSPFSHFTRNRVCSIATPTGRVTASGMRLIATSDGIKRDRTIANDDEFREVLREDFGVVL